MKTGLRRLALALIIVIAAVLCTLYFTGLLGLYTRGIASIANNTKEFTDKNGHVIPGEYSVLLDLGDLQSNVGKELYNEGGYSIYVSHIDNTGGSSTGGYRIGFRACGQYSLTGATLISGVQHSTVGDKEFTYDMSAKMKAAYKGKLYNCGVFGTSGLNYMDGDDFSFYIFPSEAYDKKEVSLDEKGTVKLTVSDLYKNAWTKK
jgi:hypothetical protein